MGTNPYKGKAPFFYLFLCPFEFTQKILHYQIFIDNDTPARQIDVFAKDDETALLVECTCCDERKEKNLNELIEKIISISKAAFTSINKHYKSGPKLKIRWIIATRNIEWRT